MKSKLTRKLDPAKSSVNRLIQLPMLLAVVLGIGGILFALFPSEQRLKEIASQRKTDALSIAYLQLLKRTHPDDATIRYALVSNLASMGKWEEARKIVEPFLSRSGNDGLTARLTMIDIDWSMLNATPETNPDRVQISTTLAAQIEKLSREPMQPTALAHLAEISRALNLPKLATLLYQKLAEAEPAKGQYWREQAARGFLESGAPLQAALEYDAIAANSQNNPPVQRRYLLLAIDAYLAANDGKSAMKLAETATDKFGQDREFMQRSVAIALSQNNPARAQLLGRQLLALAPDDPVLLDQQITVELGTKDLPAALALAQHLVALTPDNSRRTRLAQIAEWSGQPEIALDQWAVMARLNPAGEEMTHALTLAFQLENDALWLELVGKASASRALKPDEETALVAIQQRKKAPRLLITYLRNYLKNHPAQINLWKILSATMEQQGDVIGAIALWQRLVPKYISALDSAVYQATVLLHAKRADEGLAKLQAVRSQAKNSNLDYWKLFGDLAWEAKQNADALFAYRIVWESGAAQVQVAERLIQLYNASQDAVHAIAVGREAYVRMGDPRWLLLAMDSASQGKRWADLKKLVGEAKREESKFQNQEMYWLLLAQSANHDGQKSEARNAYHRALALNPNSVSTRITLLWFEIDHGEKKQLDLYLQKWRTEALKNPEFWGPYAAGLVSLQRTKESLPWFERKVRQKPNDYLWVLSYADALTQAGRTDQAWRLRRHVYQQLRPLLAKENKVQSKVLKPDDQALQLAYASLVRDFDSASAGDQALQNLLARGLNDADVFELLVASSLTQEKYDSARLWLLRAHAERHQLPAWQSLAVALNQNDKVMVGQILEQEDSKISVQDRIAALRKLGRNEQALVVTNAALLEIENDAENKANEQERQALQQNRNELAYQLSRRVDVKWNERRFGDLNIKSGRLAGSVSLGGDVRAGLQFQRNRLSSSGNDLSVVGFQNENDLSATADFIFKDDPMRFSLGVNQRSDNSLVYGRYEWLHRITKTVNTRLEASVNVITDETTALRAIGAKDKLAAGVTVNLTDFDYARVELAGQHFHTRSGTTLGSGYRFEGELGSTVFKKIPIWQVRLSGSLERNDLANQLPAELLGRVLSPSTTIDSVVSPSFSTVGVGTTIGFGHKDGLERKPYGLIDAWAGRQWPGNEFAYNLRVSMGRPILGPDQVSVEGFYGTNVQGRGTSGTANSGIGLMYKYQF